MKKIRLFCVLCCFTSAIQAQDIPQRAESVQVTILAEVTPKGQKVNAVALEYEDNILSGDDLARLYQVQTSLDNKDKQARTVLRAYVNNQAATAPRAQAGKFVIVELDVKDSNADLYSLTTVNDKPIKFRAKNKTGDVIETEKIQAIRIPQFYDEHLVYHVKQTGYLKLTNGKTLDKTEIRQSAVKNRVKTPFIDNFTARRISLNDPDNNLNYRIYTPQADATQTRETKKYPLTVFLHGSGQVGTDNIAHMLSSKGAIATLQYEDGFVLAPQYDGVFDPFDDVNKGQRGGIHWQTDNRLQLVLKMIDETLNNHPNIDHNRIYLIGLSRGSEGALNLLLKRPHFFAGALLLSGREAHTLEWMDGNATKENLASVKDSPMWFFHSKEDKVSPVQGSRINYQILHEELKAPNVKYTEFTTEQAGDNGIVNDNSHNTWDAVFNSPEVMTWLLRQTRVEDKK
ncbi:MAG TPA: phospholipase [Pasteurellaceae bacterium]|nr:phospholipase [Pasteurellaceae bacterium]